MVERKDCVLMDGESKSNNPTAVILAAGIGSRLAPLTESKPKCLVRVAGISILERQLNALANAGIEDVVIVAGHFADAAVGYCKNVSRPRVTVIINERYTETNNMYSLYLARENLAGKPFVLLNGDVAISENMVANVINRGRTDVILAEKGRYNEESMKIAVGDDGLIEDISKGLERDISYGTSIDVYLFSSQSSATLFNEIEDIIKVKKDENQWTEVALQNLVKSKRLLLRAADIGSEAWVEIDNFDDLVEADMKFSSFDISLCGRKAAFIDLDGTIYLGNTAIQGGKEFVSHLREKNIKTYFLSNNSSRGKEFYRDKLGGMGISVALDEILLSTDALIAHLQRNAVRSVFPVGTKDFIRALESSGISCCKNDAQAVVLGYDTELNYEKIKTAALLLQKPGVAYLASHCDRVCPTEDGPIPDIGSMISLFETATGRTPDMVFGKPNACMVTDILARDGLAPNDVFLLGDRIYTDGELAHRVGCDFVCVLSGETDRAMVESVDPPPQAIVRGVGDFPTGADNSKNHLDGKGGY